MGPGGRVCPPWLFGLTNVPFGVSGGYTSVAMPLILRQAHVPLVTIGAVSAAVLIPLSYQFLWAPVLDVGMRRRSWLLLLAILGSLLLGASLFLELPRQLGLFEALCVVGQGLVGLVNSCNGALISTLVRPGLHGRASGWLNAANLGGNAIGGGFVLGLSHALSAHAAGIGLALIGVIPAFAVMFLPEAVPVQGSKPLRSRFGEMLRDIWRTAKSRPGWTGILFCVAPVSTPALLDLFSAIGPDYHASDRTVEYSMGYASGLLTAAGALLGGRVLDRLNRRAAYLISGLAIAAVDVAMAFSPLSPTSYVVGTALYSLTAGFCFAAFSAMVLEIMGNAGRAAATQYTLFDAAGNLSTAYLAWMDGLGYEAFRSRQLSPPTGMLLTDASMNILGTVTLVLLMFLVFHRRLPLAAAGGGEPGSGP